MYICTYIHKNIHNCEGVKKAYSLVKNESNVTHDRVFSFLCFALLFSSLDDNTLFPHQRHHPHHQLFFIEAGGC